MYSAKSNLSLPPNVVGKKRGSIELNLSELRWKSTKSYPSVKIHILWWGQRQYQQKNRESEYIPDVLKWEQGKLSKPLHYHLQTNLELFRNYLKSCEPIQIKLFSTKTDLLIGTSTIQLPSKIINFPSDQSEVVCQASNLILSSRNFNLGEIVLNFRLSIDKVDTPAMLKVVQPVNHLIKPVKVIKKEEKEDLKVEGEKLYLQRFSPELKRKSFRSLNDVSKHNVMSYLSGKPMRNSNEESSILSEICSISPAESMIEALNKFHVLPAQHKHDLLKPIDTVKIFVQNLKLTKAGIKEIFQKSRLHFSESHFMVKCKITHLEATKLKFFSSGICNESEVEFKSEVINPIVLPKKSQDSDFCFEFCIYLLNNHYNLKKLAYLGSAKVKLGEVLNDRLTCYKRCPVKLVSDDILLGNLVVKIELGNRGLHFGCELIDAVMFDKENRTISSSDDDDAYNHFHSKTTFGMSRPTSCNQENNDGSAKNNKPSTSESKPTPSLSNNNLNLNGKQKKDDEMKVIEASDTTSKTSRLMYGLLHFGNLKNVQNLENGGYFIVCRGFWSGDDATSTEICNNLNFNYMKTFPIITNDQFLERMKNNHMTLELWQKTAESAEMLVGVTRLPLHQFYIAYRDAEITEHLSRAKLPVISIDGWSTIASPLSGEFCGQLQVVLAIGTENQIEYFKLTRGLTKTSDEILNRNRHIFSVLNLIKSTSSSFPKTDTSPTVTSKNTNANTESEVDNMLSTFIEYLAQRLPISSERCSTQETKPSEPVLASPHSQAHQPQMRKTSDLLDNLQKALSQRPPVAPSIEENILPASLMEETFNQKDEHVFNVFIEIEQALNLPKLNVSKKYGKRNKIRPNVTSPQQKTEVEPSAYVTFEGYNLQPGTINTVKSHEGIVYTTHVLERTATPVWNKKFEVQLPVDLMLNDEKRFILKIWRKSSLNDVPKCRLLPAPMEDAVIGFTSIDLSVLISGMPCILGWYNIMDFSGRCNGQIKVNIQPLEDIMKYKATDEQNNFQTPLSIDVECGNDASNASLSRALKRKFTELEEITQRLKARLFDVTGDENIDPDEEFERDLNTEACEDDDWPENVEDASGQIEEDDQIDDDDQLDDDDGEEYRGNMNGALTLTTNTSSYTRSDNNIAERNVSGCSYRPHSHLEAADQPLSLENLLKNHDIDTLINPNLFKNLINPAITSSSESTPLHAHYNVDTDECLSSNSDRIKILSRALQKTTISDSSSDNHDTTVREAPEGEHMITNDK